MTQTFYINLKTRQVQVAEPAGVSIISAAIPDQSDASLVLPMLRQMLEQVSPTPFGIADTPPNLAYKVTIGDAS